MRWLACLLSLLPAFASAQEILTLEELGALNPERSCYTGRPELLQIGVPDGLHGLDPSYLEERGGGYEVQDVGDVSFIGGPWTYQTLSGDAIQGSLVAFLQSHRNDYDFISLFVTQSLNFGAYYAPLANDTRGIGRPVYENGIEGFDNLDGYLFMNSIFDYLYNDTETARDALYFGQETGHRWGSFVRRRGGYFDMLGRDESHWNFFMDTDNSVMEGNGWLEAAGNNRWETDHMGRIGYSDLDLYLMGFIPPGDVEPWLLIKDATVAYNPVGWGGEGGIDETTTPYYYVRDYVDWDDIPPVIVTGTPVEVTIDDVTFVEGPRIPDHTLSQREFRMAFVIMHPATQPVEFDDYLVVEDTREGLKALWEDMVYDEAVLDTTLGTTDAYLFKPSVFTPTVVYEPDLFPEDDNGDLIYPGDPTGDGCQASLGGGSGGLFGLLLLLGVRRRRG
jgi:hypothetical protein